MGTWKKFYRKPKSQKNVKRHVNFQRSHRESVHGPEDEVPAWSSAKTGGLEGPIQGETQQHTRQPCDMKVGSGQHRIWRAMRRSHPWFFWLGSCLGVFALVPSLKAGHTAKPRVSEVGTGIQQGVGAWSKSIAASLQSPDIHQDKICVNSAACPTQKSGGLHVISKTTKLVEEYIHGSGVSRVFFQWCTESANPKGKIWIIWTPLKT